MALFLPGPIVSSIKGKVAGTVFSRNVAGATFRNKFIPQRKQTPIKSFINNRWQYVSQNYLTLTPAQRAAWKAYSANFTFFNKLGVPVDAKANVVAATTWLYEMQIFGVMSALPNAYFPPDSLNNITMQFSMGSNLAGITTDPSPADQYVIIYCSPPYYNNNSQYWEKRVKQLQLTLWNGGQDFFNFWSSFIAMYPYAQIGQKFTVAIRRLNYDCLAWSPLQYFEVVMEA